MKRLVSIGITMMLVGTICFSPVMQSVASADSVTAQEETNGEDTGSLVESQEDADTDTVEGEDQGGENSLMPGEENQKPEQQPDLGSEQQPGEEGEQQPGEEGEQQPGQEGEQDPREEQIEEIAPKVVYSTHVQSIGWQKEFANGEAAGTEGKALRVEGIKINLQDIPKDQGGIEYRAHVQSIGWQDFVGDGELAGTTGMKKRVEAVKIRLTGEIANQYDVYYRTHIQSYGWLDWACNGAGSGSSGHSKRIEAIEIRLVKKGEAAPGNTDRTYIYSKIAYEAHAQSVGWQGARYDDAVAGVTGKSKRLEAIKIRLPEQEYEGSIEYRVYLQTYGWQDWKKNGGLAGTTGQSKRIEAIEIKLTGDIANYYDVYYSVHLAKIGWCNYAMNGETTGSSELSKKIEALKVQLVKKGGTAPDTGGVKYIGGYAKNEFYYTAGIQGAGQSTEIQQGDTVGTIGESKRLENVTFFLNQERESAPAGNIKYATHLSKIGWQGESAQGEMNGSGDGAHGIEAIKISISGDIAKYYDIYYRAHVEKYGWMGWAKNGQSAGTSKLGYRMEALQVKLVSKDTSAPGANTGYYSEKGYRRYQNPSQYYQITDSITLTGGGYSLSYGYEGVKVMKVIQKLGLGSGIGMGGAFYGNSVKSAVANFQRRNGLVATGNVDLLTWIKMGFNQIQWEQWGAYVSPLKVNADSSRSQHIEAMISTAYSYLGTPYVIGAAGPPGTGIDCSGLVMQGLYAAGMDISPINPVRHASPGYEYESRNMWASSKFKRVPYSQRQRGDLIFYQSGSGVVIHVAIYLGNNTVIESWPNKVVVWPVTNSQRSNIKGVVRPFL